MNEVTKGLILLGIPVVACVFAFETGNRIGFDAGRIDACNAIIASSSDNMAHCRLVDGKLNVVSGSHRQEVQLVE